jgi:toxin ParE1/3/4
MIGGDRMVTFAARATADVDEQAAYLAAQSPGLGVRFVEAVVATARRLAEFPGFGRPSPVQSGKLAGSRVVRVEGFRDHLIFYATHRRRVLVIRVLHGARDLPTAAGS